MATKPFNPEDYKKTQALGADGYEALQMMKDQLLVILIERLGGKVDVTVKEVDEAPIGKIMTMEIDQTTRTFTFEVKHKQ